MRRISIPALALLAATAMPATGPAMAQDSGGLGLSPEALAVGGPRGLARPMRVTFPNIGAADLQVTSTPAERRQRHQALVARTRGDGGFLDGFSLGQPRAVSRQPLPPPVEPAFVPVIIDQRTRVVNRFEAPVAVTVGNNNLVQQQGNSSGSGPTALQQVATVGGQAAGGGSRRRGMNGGASNVVTANGNIIQAATESGHFGRAPRTNPR